MYMHYSHWHLFVSQRPDLQRVQAFEHINVILQMFNLSERWLLLGIPILSFKRKRVNFEKERKKKEVTNGCRNYGTNLTLNEEGIAMKASLGIPWSKIWILWLLSSQVSEHTVCCIVDNKYAPSSVQVCLIFAAPSWPRIKRWNWLIFLLPARFRWHLHFYSS